MLYVDPRREAKMLVSVESSISIFPEGPKKLVYDINRAIPIGVFSRPLSRISMKELVRTRELLVGSTL